MGMPVDPETTMTGIEVSLDAIREMILTGELLPGQKLHQADLANRLGVSRVPVREALSRLLAEGMLRHKPNTGFTVVRFSSDELSEVYLMRRLLETELINTSKIETIDVEHLRRLNSELRLTVPRDATDSFQRINMEFHFAIFSASPLELVRSEVARLWNMSAYYRTLYLFTEDASHLCDEHDAMIDTILRGDHGALIELCDLHRSGTQRVQVRLPARLRPG